MKMPDVRMDWSHELCFLLGALCAVIPMWGGLLSMNAHRVRAEANAVEAQKAVQQLHRDLTEMTKSAMFQTPTVE